MRTELEALRAKQASRWSTFQRAQKRFFDWLFRKNVDAWFVLDPVITVHPDEVAFECFSQDESSYGRLACSHEVFAQLGELAYGTTNVDYSYTLFDEFQKIRDDKETSFQVDPAGFEVQTGVDEAYREVKIDLPDSWVRGFLQVTTAMVLPGAVHLQLHPMDLHNLCFVLRRRKETHGPRSLRFLLEPGQPVRVKIEPFDVVLDCPRSTHDARESAEVRIWGRRRLLVLERLIPVARGVTAVLIGTGMPSFWVADCGDLTFTLGLSGWTANDWSSGGNFDLLAPRGAVDTGTAQAVMRALEGPWRASTDELSVATGFDAGTVQAAMVQYTQAGRAVYDLRNGVWRRRELSREPLDLGKLRWANEREEAAAELALAGRVQVRVDATSADGVTLTGRIDANESWLRLDGDRRLVDARCSCRFHFQNKLRKGPCEHILALRLAFERDLGRTFEERPAPAPPPRPPPAQQRQGLVQRMFATIAKPAPQAPVVPRKPRVVRKPDSFPPTDLDEPNEVDSVMRYRNAAELVPKVALAVGDVDEEGRLPVAGRIGGVDVSMVLDPDGLMVDRRVHLPDVPPVRLRRGPCEHFFAVKRAFDLRNAPPPPAAPPSPAPRRPPTPRRRASASWRCSSSGGCSTSTARSSGTSRVRWGSRSPRAASRTASRRSRSGRRSTATSPSSTTTSSTRRISSPCWRSGDRHRQPTLTVSGPGSGGGVSPCNPGGAIAVHAQSAPVHHRPGLHCAALATPVPKRWPPSSVFSGGGGGAASSGPVRSRVPSKTVLPRRCSGLRRRAPRCPARRPTRSSSSTTASARRARTTSSSRRWCG
ncbi:MAG: SWIM zinc finger family protein [Myxococcota bacterium]